MLRSVFIRFESAVAVVVEGCQGQSCVGNNNSGLSFEECMGFPTGGNSRRAPLAGRGGSGGQPPAPPVFSALDLSSDEILDEFESADTPSSLPRGPGRDASLQSRSCRRASSFSTVSLALSPPAATALATARRAASRRPRSSSRRAAWSHAPGRCGASWYQA